MTCLDCHKIVGEAMDGFVNPYVRYLASNIILKLSIDLVHHFNSFFSGFMFIFIESVFL